MFTNCAATLPLAECVALMRVGSGADETLTGTAHRDRIFGGGGQDSILGLDGRDKPIGGAGLVVSDITVIA